jgi:hypothetical protein
MRRSLPPHADGERGATAIIVVLSLVAIFGLIVLTVDVGQLLFKRRAMVNASDAAALAAAQTCAGLLDSDVPESMADTFALDNVSIANAGAVNITDMVGCDGPAFGHVTVDYSMNQDLFFAGVLGFNGPAAVSTEATAGWGPAGGANPMPVVVYTGSGQGNCDIEPGIGVGVPCYLWFDNDLFEGSAFGFLNLCTATDSCSQGWDVAATDSCPSVGTSLRNEWIAGTWQGGPNRINYPAETFVCRVSGLSSDNWSNLEAREGGVSPPNAPHNPDGDVHDLLFPVNDCTTQVDNSGTRIGCDTNVAPDKYNIIGFIMLHLVDVLDSSSEWGGVPYSHCQRNQTLNPNQVFALSDLMTGQCPSGSTPSGVENLTIEGQPPGTTYTYDDATKTITWNGPMARNARFDFNWWLDGECGQPPSNESAVCLKVTTVEARFGGNTPCPNCPDFGTRAVRLCDLAIGSCPQDAS